MTSCVVVGAGPAGLTAAWELARLGCDAVVLEQDDTVGGISRTCSYGGYRFDVGGHRFFTKVPLVDRLWAEMLDDEFLRRPRLSRILYGGTLFDYPLKPLNALRGLGPFEALRIGTSYLRARAWPSREERSFEQWVTNRFGSRLFEIFFKTYTEKVWGMPCSEISADWAEQRIKNLDLMGAVRNALFGERQSGAEVVSTLIDEFHYPRLGPGQMWESCSKQLAKQGVGMRLGEKVIRVARDGRRIQAVETRSATGETSRVEGDEFLSSMPLRSLLRVLDPAPPDAVRQAGERLAYRDFLTVVLIVNRAEVFPDNWIYIHSPEVQVGRIQNFKNWSPEMVPDPSTTSLGLEYFVHQGDPLWTASDEHLLALAARECSQIGLVDPDEVFDGTVLRVPKAYPIYDSGYAEALGTIRAWVEEIENLHPMGRNGLHRYNNQDHSMVTAVHAARNAAAHTREHEVWDVNVDTDYHEEIREPSATTERLVPGRLPAREDA